MTIDSLFERGRNQAYSDMLNYLSNIKSDVIFVSDAHRAVMSMSANLPIEQVEPMKDVTPSTETPSEEMKNLIHAASAMQSTLLNLKALASTSGFDPTSVTCMIDATMAFVHGEER